MKTGNRIFLYAGLSLLVIAFVVKGFHVSIYGFWILLGLAISFKVIFLILTFRSKSIRVGLWLYLILAGVAMILLSLLFKNTFMHNTLFYSAILLKITGLILLLSGKMKTK